MDEIAQRMIEVRQEIAHLRAALRTTADADSRQQIYRRLTACVTEATRLIEQRIQQCGVDSSDEPLRERSVGEVPRR
jgi:hypothetical protein